MEMENQSKYDINYVINNIQDFNVNELLSFNFCKILDTPRYKNSNIIVFKNGMFYSIISNKFISKRRKKQKTYTTIFVKNNEQSYTTMIVPYIICYLFKDEYLKHGKNEKNYFKYIDGNCDNCDADNIRANYYEYNILRYVTNDIVEVNICGYGVLLDLEFALKELSKHRFYINNSVNSQNIYFSTETNGRSIKLHQLVMKYYYPDMEFTGVIDHINHNTLDNTVGNLNHINHIINSMNNMNILPNWNEDKQTWSVRYRIDNIGYSKSFSVYNYNTKEDAYKNAIDYINTVVIPQKKEYIKNKNFELKRLELDDLVKYFINNNKIEEILNVLSQNGINVSDTKNLKSDLINK